MNPVEIAYFKHFLFDKDLTRSFLYFYRTRHINGGPRGDREGNPDSIEEYFLQTSAKDVILKAFYFAPTNNNAQRIDQTFDYWKDIDDKWQAYMKDNESNFSNDTWPTLRKTFAILRQNWDVPNYYRKENLESTEEVYKRMHIDLPMPEFLWEHGYAPPKNTRNDAEHILINVHNAQDGDVLVRIHKNDNGDTFRVVFLFRELVPCEIDGVRVYKAMTYCLYAIHTKKLFVSNEDHGNIIVNDSDKNVCFRLAFDEERNLLMKKLEEEGLAWDEQNKRIYMEDISVSEEDEDDSDDLEIDFVPIDTTRRFRNGLAKGVISVNTNKGWKISFNRIDTKDIIKQKNVKYAWVGKTKSGDVVIQLNRNDKGAPIVFTSDGYCNVNNRQLVENLRSMLSITEILVYLRIEKISVKMDSITYKITKQ